MLGSLRRFFFKPSADESAALRLYAAIVAQARQPAFYAMLGVPDTPTGRFDLVVLHGFLLMDRLRSQPGAERLGRGVAEVLVADLDHNLREMGEGDLAVGKKVKRLTSGAYGRMEAYLLAVATPESAALEEALLRNLYAGNSPGDEVLGAMAAYIRRERDALRQQSGQTLARGEITFGAPPSPALSND